MQGLRQSVQNYVNFLDRHKKLLPGLSEETRRLHLLKGLRPEIHKAVTERADIPETYRGVVHLATICEEAQKESRWRGQAHDSATPRTRESRSKNKPSHGGNDDVENPGQEIEPAGSKRCKFCKKLGHTESVCYAKHGKPGESSGPGATAAATSTNLNVVLASRLDTALKHISAEVAVHTPSG
ncbi:MAG: hypothetical protein M1826_005125 [Phylliscum demangeonii]|nr:MAG: hypothetical protein M1826_005125 [Phylliscum demangeonii]